ncbi:MAG: lytic transglycosylase domain-containing protein, partial [Acidobacteria bacterium]|nr:lytic transglycosylase domain-containing protein [Acidobacteriota bacterium]
PFRAEIAAAARRAGIHPWLLAALVQAESGFNPRARSPAGASGLAQLMPVTAAEEHVHDIWDPMQNLRAGAMFLRKLLDRFRSLPLALAAYNSGAATVTRAGGVPPYRETRQFIRHVLAVFCPSLTSGRRTPSTHRP